MDSQVKFFTDNLIMHVYLQDDIIIKQGDLAGPEEYFYIIIEGLAEVIQEKRDFCFYHLDSTRMFLKDNGHSEMRKKMDEWMNQAVHQEVQITDNSRLSINSQKKILRAKGKLMKEVMMQAD